MRVTEILERKGRDVVSLPPSETIAGAARVLADRKIGALLILDGGQIVGILSERDLVRSVRDAGPFTAPVTAIMSTDLKTCAPYDELHTVAERMTEERIRHLPVLEDGELIGIISIGDVVKARLEDLEQERDHLVSYVHGTPPGA